MMNMNKDHCQKEDEIATIKAQVKTLFKNEDRLEQTLNKLDNTQNKLSESITSIEATFKSIIRVLGIIGGIITIIISFLIMELIKII